MECNQGYRFFFKYIQTCVVIRLYYYGSMTSLLVAYLEMRRKTVISRNKHHSRIRTVAAFPSSSIRVSQLMINGFIYTRVKINISSYNNTTKKTNTRHTSPQPQRSFSKEGQRSVSSDLPHSVLKD